MQIVQLIVNTQEVFLNFELELEWTTLNSGQSWCGYNTPITGDVDGDGVPEILGKPCTGGGGSPWPNIIVVDGASGNIENDIYYTCISIY